MRDGTSFMDKNEKCYFRPTFFQKLKEVHGSTLKKLTCVLYCLIKKKKLKILKTLKKKLFGKIKIEECFEPLI
jgi:hypothetical protein